MCKLAHMPNGEQVAREVIARALEKTGWTATELARRAGVAPSTLTRFLNSPEAKHVPSTKTLTKVAEAANVAGPSVPIVEASEDEFFEANAIPVPDVGPLQPRRLSNRMVPVMGTAAGGDDGFFEINLTDGPVEYTQLPPNLATVKQGDLFAIRVHGESMEPIWEPGDLVFILKSRPLKRGAYVVVQIERGKGEHPRALLKQFLRQDDDKLVLAQWNPRKEMLIPRSQVLNIWRALHWRDFAQQDG